MTAPNPQPGEPEAELEDDPFEETGSLDDVIRRVVGESPEVEHAYLRESWLASVMGLLHRVRIAAGLSQEEVAQRLETRQPSIARLERASSTTLRRFWEFLHACGVVPADIETVPMAEMASYVRAHPSASRSVDSVRQWSEHEDAVASRGLLEQYLLAFKNILQQARIGQEVVPSPPTPLQKVRPLGPYMYQVAAAEREAVSVVTPQMVSFNAQTIRPTGNARFLNVSPGQRGYAGEAGMVRQDALVTQQPRTVA